MGPVSLPAVWGKDNHSPRERTMNGFITRARTVLCGVGLLATVQGCHSYYDLVDPCYPQRYWYTSRQAVNEAFAPQVQNGHILDQTIYNWMFEPESDKLTAG